MVDALVGMGAGVIIAAVLCLIVERLYREDICDEYAWCLSCGLACQHLAPEDRLLLDDAPSRRAGAVLHAREEDIG